MLITSQSVQESIKNSRPALHEIYMWYLGQEGFALKCGEETLVIDPYLTDSIDRMNNSDNGFKRLYPPPVTPLELSFAQLILCTHDHQDHLDPETINGINSGANMFGVPAPVKNCIKECGVDESRIVPLFADVPFECKIGKIIPFPAAHDVLHQQDGAYCELSYLIQYKNGLRVFHGGDMVIYQGLEEKLREANPHVVMLPVNGRCYYRESAGIVGNTNVREAADLAYRVGAKLFIPMHYDLYPGNAENPAVITDYLYRTYPRMPYHLFTPGEGMCLSFGI